MGKACGCAGDCNLWRSETHYSLSINYPSTIHQLSITIWENPLEIAIFNSYVTNYRRVSIMKSSKLRGLLACQLRLQGLQLTPHCAQLKAGDFGRSGGLVAPGKAHGKPMGFSQISQGKSTISESKQRGNHGITMVDNWINSIKIG